MAFSFLMTSTPYSRWRHHLWNHDEVEKIRPDPSGPILRVWIDCGTESLGQRSRFQGNAISIFNLLIHFNQ